MMVEEFGFKLGKVEGQARLFISMIAQETIIERAMVSSNGFILYLYHMVI